MFARLETLIGKEKLDLIASKKILVLGVGGVGGFVIEGLVRSGIVNVTIVDKDIIEETNLNRQIIALRSTIGKYKADVMKSRIEDINANAKVSVIKKQIVTSDIEFLNLDKYDYIVDAIDDVPVKLALIKYALKNNLKFIVSTGTAKKLDPSKLKITTLDKTAYDPLAKKLRYELKGEKLNKVLVLASDEEPIKRSDNQLGSSAFVPSAGGLLIASYIIRDILKN